VADRQGLRRLGDAVCFIGCIVALPSLFLALGNAGVLMQGTDHPNLAISRIIIGAVTAVGAWLAGWVARYFIVGDWDIPRRLLDPVRLDLESPISQSLTFIYQRNCFFEFVP
jgi:hypothetical protein